MVSKKIIINADDLGRTAGINAGIFEAHSRGIVSSATLMVGYDAATTAAAELGRYPDLGVGLHVALTGGRPTLPLADVPSLVDADGFLPRKPENAVGFQYEDVLAEVRHQLKLFCRLTDRLPTHLDSHHHCQRLPVVLDAIVTVARERGLPVRNASPEVGQRLRQEGLVTTDRFVDRFYGDGVRAEVLHEILAEAGEGTTEVMCHPGQACDELRAGSGYAEERELETRLLTAPGLQQKLQQHGLELVHFGSAF